MAGKQGKLNRAIDLIYIVIVLAIWAGAIWAFISYVLIPEPGSFVFQYSEAHHLEMLEPRWLGLGLIVPALWLVRKWSLSDLPWLQKLLNVTIRSLLILSLCLAVTRVVVTEFDSNICTVFVIDVSKSVPDSLITEAQAYVQEVYTERRSDEVRLVTFAREAREVDITPGATQIPELLRHEEAGAGLQSNLDAALRLSYGLFPPDHLKRIVLITDGNINRGDLLSEAYNAARYGVRIFSREIDYQREEEVLIRAVDFPDGIVANEPFHITVDVFSTFDGEIRLDLTQNDYRDIRGRRFDVRSGVVEQLDLVAEVYEPGLRTFEIEISAQEDRFQDNNRFVHVVNVQGRPQVLYVEGESRQRTYLQRALDDERNSRVSFDLDVRTRRGFPTTLEEMRVFDLIILSDVEARYISRTAMSNLREYVRSFGGGFLMVGGESSFGPGGYQGTGIEEMLPVTFEGRRSETMPSIALMLIIDRSGSMDGLKLEMAKDAARAAVELLGPQDRIGVIAFDTSPQQVVRLQRASNRVSIDEDISRVSPGGGTEIYPALEEAYLQLSTARARIKHVILLTDGQAPTDGISELVGDMRSERITVSTVGVGSDADRNLLEMIADISGGHYYQTSNAHNIPQIFVQDTSQITRTNLVEEPFRPSVVSQSTATRGIDFSTAPYLLGYVSTRARSGATIGLETDLGEPLYAHWRFGRGRTAVFTSDCKNRWMVEWIRESIYPRFWAQVTHHLMRRQQDDEQELDMRSSVRNGRGQISVDAVGSDDSFINNLQSTVRITDPSQNEFEVSLEQVAAGRYEAQFELAEYGSYILDGEHLLNGDSYAVSVASLANPYPDEYMTVDANHTPIRQAVLLGGGSVNPSVDTLFDPGEERIPSERDLWPYFLFVALGLFVLDVLLRRIRLYGRIALSWSTVTRQR